MNRQVKLGNIVARDVAALSRPASWAELTVEDYFREQRPSSPNYTGQLRPAFQQALQQFHAGLSAADCDFYHNVEFPDGRHFQGDWDLRGHEQRYAGGAFLSEPDFSGKRILECGPATGALSAYLAPLADELVVVDLPFGAGPELVPHIDIDIKTAAASGVVSATRLRNSWWFTKAALNYQAKAVYADIYQLPADIGRFDIALFGALLLHLSSPFKALQQAACLVDDALIVTEIDNAPAMPGLDQNDASYPAMMAFNQGALPNSLVHWWSFSPAAITRMLQRLGFEDVRTDTHTPPHMAGKTSLFTVVGRRAKRSHVTVHAAAHVGVCEHASTLPLPPAEARFLVAGTADEAVFLELGRQGFHALTAGLERASIEPSCAGRVLDFGCGVGRVLRYWADFTGVEMHGTDYQGEAVAWCRDNLPFATVATNTLDAKLDYPDEYFDVIYALSVFTHLPDAMQVSWFGELCRILQPGGVIYFSAHGDFYSFLFDAEAAETFAAGCLVVTGGDRPGTNVCAAFHPPAYVERVFAGGFGLQLLEHLPCGAKGNPEQDSYILRKPTGIANG